jgi:hypothetical protein
MVHLGLEAVLAGTPATICKTKVWACKACFGRVGLLQDMQNAHLEAN